jgi:hypothetical protein
MRETRTAMADTTRPLMTGALAEISVGGPGLGQQITFNLSPNSSEQIVLNFVGRILLQFRKQFVGQYLRERRAHASAQIGKSTGAVGGNHVISVRLLHRRIHVTALTVVVPFTTISWTTRAPSPSAFFALPRCALGLLPTAGVCLCLSPMRCLTFRPSPCSAVQSLSPVV